MWFTTAMNRNVSTGPLARPFAHLLATLIHSFPSSRESLRFDVIKRPNFVPQWSRESRPTPTKKRESYPSISPCSSIIPPSLSLVISSFTILNTISFFFIDFQIGAWARYGGIKVGWKKIQRNIGHFLVLVEYISIAISYKRKKFTVQFFNN